MNIEYSFLDFISEVDPTGQHSDKLVELYEKRLSEMDSRATNYLAFEDNVGLPFNSDGIVNSQRVAFIEFLGKDEFEEIFGIDNSEKMGQYELESLISEYVTKECNKILKSDIERLIIGGDRPKNKNLFLRVFGF